MVNIRDFTAQLSNDNKKHIIADIDVDTASELPNQEFNGYFLAMGSIARDISTGDFYSIDSAGEWHIQGGTS